jgi:RNA polymerase sigma-B factor
MSAERSHQLDRGATPHSEALSRVASNQPFSVIVDQHHPDIVLLTVMGEIDLLTESRLGNQLSSLLALRPQCLIIDLSQVSFLGATALSVLINTKHAADEQGATLQLRVPNRPVPTRALEITGLDCLLEILPPASGDEEPHNNGTTVVTALEAPARGEQETDQGEYAHLVSLHRRYAELAPDLVERQQARDALINGYLPLAEHVARRFAGRGEPLDDLVQVATVGLINAVDRFEPDRGSHFLSFAIPTITGELRRYFRDHGWSARVPRRVKDLYLAVRGALVDLSQRLGRSPRPSEIADQLGIPTEKVIEALHAGEAYRSSSLDEMLSYGDTTAAHKKVVGELDAELWRIDDREALRPLLAELPARERTILALRFFHELTQAQIAEHVGISQMHVSRVLRQTLTFLQQRMNENACADH